MYCKLVSHKRKQPVAGCPGNPTGVQQLVQSCGKDSLQWLQHWRACYTCVVAGQADAQHGGD